MKLDKRPDVQAFKKNSREAHKAGKAGDHAKATDLHWDAMRMHEDAADKSRGSIRQAHLDAMEAHRAASDYHHRKIK